MDEVFTNQTVLEEMSESLSTSTATLAWCVWYFFGSTPISKGSSGQTFLLILCFKQDDATPLCLEIHYHQKGIISRILTSNPIRRFASLAALGRKVKSRSGKFQWWIPLGEVIPQKCDLPTVFFLFGLTWDLIFLGSWTLHFLCVCPFLQVEDLGKIPITRMNLSGGLKLGGSKPSDFWGGVNNCYASQCVWRVWYWKKVLWFTHSKQTYSIYMNTLPLGWSVGPVSVVFYKT